MGLNQVKEEVINEAKQRAKEIVGEGKREAKEISKKADEEVKQYAEEARLQNDKLKEAMERKMLSAARFDSQRLLMNTKKEIIEEVISNVNSKLTSLAEAKRKKFLQSLLKEAQKEIKVDTVFVNKKDLKLMDNQFNLEAGDLSGGLIAQNKDGSVSVDYSVEDLLETASSELLIKISGVLFGNK